MLAIKLLQPSSTRARDLLWIKWIIPGTPNFTTYWLVRLWVVDTYCQQVRLYGPIIFRRTIPIRQVNKLWNWVWCLCNCPTKFNDIKQNKERIINLSSFLAALIQCNNIIIVFSTMLLTMLTINLYGYFINININKSVRLNESPWNTHKHTYRDFVEEWFLFVTFENRGRLFEQRSN